MRFIKKLIGFTLLVLCLGALFVGGRLVWQGYLSLIHISLSILRR